MACACKVSQDIALLQKRYGNGQPNKTTNIRGSFKDILKYTLLLLLKILFSPLMAIFVLFSAIFSNFKHKAIDITAVIKRLTKIFK